MLRLVAAACRLAFLAFICACLIATRGCYATSIQPDPRSHSSNGNSLSTPEALGLLSEEHSAIFSAHHTLLSLKSKPDCFQDAVASFELQCGERLSASQGQKAETAVRLTGCDLSTGNQHLPTECLRMPQAPPQQALSRCIEALSRSPQQWSTYSGYMRELPSLCFALRREKGLQDAQELYYNMTQEKQALLKALQRMHAASEVDRERAAAAMEDQIAGFNDAITRLEETAKQARQAGDLVTARYGESLNALVTDVHALAQEATEAVLAVLSQQLPDWLSTTMATELRRVADSHFKDLGSAAENKVAMLFDQLQHGVEHQLIQHEGHIAELSASLLSSQSLVKEVFVGLNAVRSATAASAQELELHRRALADTSAYNVERLDALDSLLSRVEGVALQDLQRWEREEQRRQQMGRRNVVTRIFMGALGLGDEVPSRSSVTDALIKATPLAKALLYSGGPAPLHILVTTLLAIIKLGWSAFSLLLTVWLLLFALSTRMLRPLTSRLARWLESRVRGALLRERRSGGIEEGGGRYDSEEEGEVEAMLQVTSMFIKASRSPTPPSLHHDAPPTLPPRSSLPNTAVVLGDRRRRSMSAF